VFAGDNEEPVSVKQGMSLPFAGVLLSEQASEQPKDAFSDWSAGRGESITADNAITAQIGEDAAPAMPGSYGFTYYPFLGLHSLDLNPAAPYSSYLPRQPGFNSIYLPGYTYRPFLLGIMGIGSTGRRFPTYPLSPPRVGVAPGAGYITPLPRIGVTPGAGYITPLPRIGVTPGAGYTNPLPRAGVTPGTGYTTPLPRTPVRGPGTIHAPPAIGLRGGAHR
jgi:hypothetical protein